MEWNYKEKQREQFIGHECGKYLGKRVTGYALPNPEPRGKGSYSTGGIRGSRG